MNKKSWVAMAGLCVLLATPAAQAHLIRLCLDAYASGTEVSGAFDGDTLSQVTFTEAGWPSSEVTSFAWQDASGKAEPYWSASSALIGNCPQRDRSSSSSQPRQSREVPRDQMADLIRFDATSLTHSPWAQAFEVAGTPSALTPVQKFNQELGQQEMLSSAAGNIGRIPGHTFNQAFGRPSVTHGAEGGNIGRAPVQTSNQALGQPSATLSSAADNSSSAPTPVQTIDQALGPPSATPSPAAGDTSRNPIAGNAGHPIVSSPDKNANVTTVPEPETLALLMIGLLGVALTTRRRHTPAANG